MRQRGDSRAAMHVYADVAIRRHRRRPGVEPHAHADGAGAECRLSRPGGRDGAGSGGERNEERVALCVYLDAAVRGERIAEQQTMLGERVRIPLRAESVQQTGRALDVREEEGDRAGRELGRMGSA